jgi:hypothetical protein
LIITYLRTMFSGRRLLLFERIRYLRGHPKYNINQPESAESSREFQAFTDGQVKPEISIL